jgi:predicted amidohydrolase
MSFRVALLQIESFGIDQSRNLEKGMEQCREAKC